MYTLVTLFGIRCEASSSSIVRIDDTNPVPYIEQVGSFGRSQNVTGRIMATTANRDRS